MVRFLISHPLLRKSLHDFAMNLIFWCTYWKNYSDCILLTANQAKLNPCLSKYHWLTTRRIFKSFLQCALTCQIGLCERLSVEKMKTFYVTVLYICYLFWFVRWEFFKVHLSVKYIVFFYTSIGKLDVINCTRWLCIKFIILIFGFKFCETSHKKCDAGDKYTNPNTHVVKSKTREIYSTPASQKDDLWDGSRG